MRGPQEVQCGQIPVFVIRPPLCHEVNVPEIRPWACEEHEECRRVRWNLLLLTIETILLCALYREYVSDPAKHAGKEGSFVMLVLAMAVHTIDLWVIELRFAKAASPWAKKDPPHGC